MPYLKAGSVRATWHPWPGGLRVLQVAWVSAGGATKTACAPLGRIEGELVKYEASYNAPAGLVGTYSIRLWDEYDTDLLCDCAAAIASATATAPIYATLGSERVRRVLIMGMPTFYLATLGAGAYGIFKLFVRAGQYRPAN